MPVLRSQTVYLSITVFLSLALSQQHTLLLSPVLSQHHAALALSCALLCLSITLLLLSHVPCFVSASRCTAYHATLILMCLASSQYCSRRSYVVSGSHVGVCVCLTAFLATLSSSLLSLSRPPSFLFPSFPHTSLSLSINQFL